MEFKSSPPRHYKCLLLLAMLYVTADLASCALSYKFVKFGPVFFSVETLIFPITYVFTDMISEVYGYKVARNLIWIVFLCDTLFALITSLLVHMPSPSAETQHIYNVVFASLLRGSTAEIAGVLSGTFLNIYIISKLKILTKGKYFWLRSIFSSTIGEAILVLVAMPIMFWGTTSTHDLVVLMCFSYLYKIVFAVVAAIPANVTVALLKRVEKVDVYDHNVNFNPFATFRPEKS